MDQPGNVANSARGQLNRKMNTSLSPFAPESLGSRNRFEVLSRVSLLISILRLKLVLTYRIPPEFGGCVHIFFLNRHTPSGQSRVYRITQLA